MVASPIDRHVRAESSDCRRCLGEILSLVLAHGGRVHPGACCDEVQGNMTVTCEPMPTAGQHPLIEVPRELLVPVSEAEWEKGGEQLLLLKPPPGLTPVQRQLLDAHVELYNAAGKPAWTLSHHPRVAAIAFPEILDALRSLRPEQFQDLISPAKVFLSTRVFELLLAGNPAADRQEKIQVLMPLIDILNHHPRGAPFTLPDKGIWVRMAQPQNDRECFAAYGGRRDVLDMALHYGYLDSATPYAFSSPVSIELSNFGQIQIGPGRARSAHPLDLPKVEWVGETLCLSHFCANLNHPERLHSALLLPLMAAARKRGLSSEETARRVREAVEALCQANVDLLDKLITAVAPFRKVVPAADLLSRAAQRQSDIFRQVMVG